MAKDPASVGAADFKQRCLHILDALPAEGVIITKRGKQVARLTPIRPSTLDLFGILAGKAKSLGDIVDTADLEAECEWTADAHNIKPAVSKRKAKR